MVALTIAAVLARGVMALALVLPLLVACGNSSESDTGTTQTVATPTTHVAAPTAMETATLTATATIAVATTPSLATMPATPTTVRSTPVTSVATLTPSQPGTYDLVGILPLLLPSEDDVSAIFGMKMRQTVIGPGGLGQEFEAVPIVADYSGIYTSEAFQELMVIVGLALFGTEAEAAEFPFTHAGLDIPGMTAFDVYDTGDQGRGYVLGPVSDEPVSMHLSWLTFQAGRVIVSIWVGRQGEEDMRDPMRLLGHGISRWIDSVGPGAPALSIELITEAPAPAGLGSIALPLSTQDITTVFEQFPDSALGFPRIALPEGMSGPEDTWHPRCASDCRHAVSYGGIAASSDPDVIGGITAINIIGITDFYPRTWGAGHVIAEEFIQQRQLDSQMPPGVAITPPPLPDAHDGFAEGVWRDGALIWGRSVHDVDADSGSETKRAYKIMFGWLDGPWLFDISADSPESVDALLDAFVEVMTSGR